MEVKKPEAYGKEVSKWGTLSCCWIGGPTDNYCQR